MIKWIYVNCQQCGKEFYTYPSQIKQGKGKFCSASCGAKYSAIERGKLGLAESKSRLCKVARKIYIENFGDPICEQCGAKNADVHHRDENRKNRSIENLIALCRSCHTAHHNRKTSRRRGKTNEIL
jgi:hypothetical protein